MLHRSLSADEASSFKLLILPQDATSTRMNSKVDDQWTSLGCADLRGKAFTRSQWTGAHKRKPPAGDQRTPSLESIPSYPDVNWTFLEHRIWGYDYEARALMGSGITASDSRSQNRVVGFWHLSGFKLRINKSKDSYKNFRYASSTVLSFPSPKKENDKGSRWVDLSLVYFPSSRPIVEGIGVSVRSKPSRGGYGRSS